MRGDFLNAGRRQHRALDSPKPPVHRLVFAAVTTACLFISVLLLYSVTALHFATESWGFLHIPKFDPGPLADSEKLVLLLLQIVGGMFLGASCLGDLKIGRTLKWLPLFVVAFAVLTWILALLLGPWRT